MISNDLTASKVDFILAYKTLSLQVRKYGDTRTCHLLNYMFYFSRGSLLLHNTIPYSINVCFIVSQSDATTALDICSGL